jgi:subtilisin family serine protease
MSVRDANKKVRNSSLRDNVIPFRPRTKPAEPNRGPREARTDQARETRPARGTADETRISREAQESDSSSDFAGGLIDRFKDAFGFGEDSKRAEAKDENATIAVFDSFNGADDKGESTHGEQVEGVIQQEGNFSDEDIQRYQINSGGSLDDLKDGLADGDEEAFDQYIEDRYTSLLDNTSDGLEEILDDEDSQIRTINQSQSVAEGRIARDLWNEAKEDEGFRSDLARSLGLDEDVSDRELAQALVDGIGDSVANSDAIAESKERYDEVSRRAAEAGISHVVTSGNLGSFADELDALGVETDAQFYDSALANEHKIVVGATDDGRTAADFTSPDANADISAPGVDIAIRTQDGAKETNSGTSFSAPMVAAVVAQISAENPHLTPAEIEALLVETADPVKASEEEDIGAGNLNPEEALAQAA